VNWRKKTLISLFGELHIIGSYYHCATCHTGQQPWSARLRVGRHRVTPAAAEAIALAGLLTSFGRASRQTLQKLTGIRVSESTVERVTEEAGQQLAARREQKEVFGPTRPWNWQHDARGQTCGYTSLDFVSVPQQGPQAARADSRMAAVGLVYNPQSKHDDPLPRGNDEVRYLAGFYALDALGRQLRRQAAQVGWDELQQQLAISDAGKGLEDFQRQNFARAKRMLDFFHASEHVGRMAQAVHPRDPEQAQRYTSAGCRTLKDAGGIALRREWEQLETQGWNEQRRETYRVELGYFRNHEHKMDYPRYLANGWQIGSGPVESACKRVVTQRLKGAGMRWSEQGSNAVCHLHALLLSQNGSWDGFWDSQNHLQN
jgi:hypothetical protein